MKERPRSRRNYGEGNYGQTGIMLARSGKRETLSESFIQAIFEKHDFRYRQIAKAHVFGKILVDETFCAFIDPAFPFILCSLIFFQPDCQPGSFEMQSKRPWGSVHQMARIRSIYSKLVWFFMRTTLPSSILFISIIRITVASQNKSMLCSNIFAPG